MYCCNIENSMLTPLACFGSSWCFVLWVRFTFVGFDIFLVFIRRRHGGWSVQLIWNEIWWNFVSFFKLLQRDTGEIARGTGKRHPLTCHCKYGVKTCLWRTRSVVIHSSEEKPPCMDTLCPCITSFIALSGKNGSYSYFEDGRGFATK